MLGAGVHDTDVVVWGADPMGQGFRRRFLRQCLGQWCGVGVCCFMDEVGAHLCGFLPWVFTFKGFGVCALEGAQL